MALTLTAPASSENDTIVVVLASDEGNFFNIDDEDFTLRREDTNAVIGSNITAGLWVRSGANYRWNITVTQTDAYTGQVYLQLAANSIRSLTTLSRAPSRPLNSNNFRFRVVPAPDAPSNLAGTVAFRSVRLTWALDAAETYEVRRDGGSWEDATSPLDVTGLAPETAYTFEVRVKARGFAPAGDAASITLTTLAAPPAPVISVDSAPINFTINTPINFPIPISNNPHPVTIRGDVEELYYDWDGENLYLRGTATRTRANRRLIISATDSADPTNVVTAELTYNVRNAQPIITQIPAVRIVRGVEQSIFIPIANNPSQVVVEGLLTGLDHRRATQNDQEGVEIIGTVPIDANFTTETGRFWISTENDGGEDAWGTQENGGLGWTLARASLPAQVSNLRTTVRGTSVTLNWDSPADGGTPITQYEYQVDSGEWASTLSTTTQLVISSLVPRATAYRIRVRAINGLGAGPASRTVSLRLARKPSKPGTLKVSLNGRDAILNWDPPRDKGLPEATYDAYIILKEPGSEPPALNDFMPGDRMNGRPITGTTFTNPSIGSEFDRYYTVDAFNLAGRSDKSNIVLLGPPGLVQSLNISTDTYIYSGNNVNVRLVVNFSAPASTGGAPIQRYEMRYRFTQFRPPRTRLWLGGWSSWNTYVSGATFDTPRYREAYFDFHDGTVVEVRAVNGVGAGQVASAGRIPNS